MFIILYTKLGVYQKEKKKRREEEEKKVFEKR